MPFRRPDRLIELPADPEFRLARIQAVRRLTAREYSAAEMRAYLHGKGVDEETARAVVESLIQTRHIDDLRFAEALIRREALRKKGLAAIRAQLREKGVSLPPGKLEELYREQAGPDEAELARALVQRRYPRAESDPGERRKALAALLRRGFSAEAARRCLPRGPDEESDELAEPDPDFT